MIKRRMSQWDKTLRAISVYIELLDTAEWLKCELRGQLASFGLTYPGLRVLEVLRRLGPMERSALARQRNCNRANLDVVIAPLEKRGWVERRIVRLPAVKIKRSRLPKALRGKQRLGKRVAMFGLTPAGHEFAGNFLPKHAKVIKALMRALLWTEQAKLIDLCKKLREGNILKFFSEITHQEVWEKDQAN
jgi:hypothetical protein